MNATDAPFPFRDQAQAILDEIAEFDKINAQRDPCDRSTKVFSAKPLEPILKWLVGNTYDRTPVDALLSDLSVDAMLDALEPDHVQDRIKEFGIEVGVLDNEGKPIGV